MIYISNIYLKTKISVFEFKKYIQNEDISFWIDIDKKNVNCIIQDNFPEGK